MAAASGYVTPVPGGGRSGGAGGAGGWRRGSSLCAEGPPVQIAGSAHPPANVSAHNAGFWRRSRSCVLLTVDSWTLNVIYQGETFPFF